MKKESKLYVFLFDLNEKIREYIYIGSLGDGFDPIFQTTAGGWF